MKNIKHLRIDKGIKQNELARRIGITQAHLSNIENGKAKPGTSVLISIAKELGVTVDSILNSAA